MSNRLQLLCQIMLLVLLASANAFAEGSSNSDPEQIFFDNPIAVYGREVRYDVLRNDKKIGEHIVVFDRGGDTMLITAESDLSVRYLGIPIYRYRYRAKEIWVDGKFVSVESEIRDNRKAPRVIKAEVQGRVLEVSDRGKSRLAPRVEFASTHWHPAALKESRLFHTTHGRVRHINVENLGQERIALRLSGPAGQQGESDSVTRAVMATHFRVTGGFKAELWYDSQLRWIRLRFHADDGSLIDYKCTTCYSE